MPQLHITDQPTTLRRRATAQLQSQNIRKITKVKQPALSLPRQDDCKLERTLITLYQNNDLTKNPQKQWDQQYTMDHNTRTTTLERTPVYATRGLNAFQERYFISS